MPALLPAPIRRAAEKSTLQFDWLLGERQFWSLKSAAGLLGFSSRFLEKLWDTGQIAGHEFNAGRDKRQTKRIPRAFLVALLTKTAKYSADAKLQAFLSCLREFEPEDLEQIIGAARAEQQRRTGR